MSLKSILLSFFMLIVGILIGASTVYFYFGSVLPKGVMTSIQNGQFKKSIAPPIQNGMNNPAARNAFVMKRTGGIIDSFVGNTMKIKTFAMSPNSKDNNIMNVAISEKTKFQSMTPKDMAVYQKEMQDFQKISADKRGTAVQPLPYTLKEISKESLTAGKQVMIETVNPVTASTTQVIAESINLLPEMPKPAK